MNQDARPLFVNCTLRQRFQELGRGIEARHLKVNVADFRNNMSIAAGAWTTRTYAFSQRIE